MIADRWTAAPLAALLLALPFLQSACSTAPANFTTEDGHVVTISQGLWGIVTVEPGSFGVIRGPRRPVSREIYVFEPTVAEPWMRVGLHHVTSIPSHLVDKTRSADDGFYELPLPAGQYSLVVADGDSYYVPGFGRNGEISPIVVGPGRLIRYDPRMFDQ